MGTKNYDRYTKWQDMLYGQEQRTASIYIQNYELLERLIGLQLYLKESMEEHTRQHFTLDQDLIYDVFTDNLNALTMTFESLKYGFHTTPILLRTIFDALALMYYVMANPNKVSEINDCFAIYKMGYDQCKEIIDFIDDDFHQFLHERYLGDANKLEEFKKRFKKSNYYSYGWIIGNIYTLHKKEILHEVYHVMSSYVHPSAGRSKLTNNKLIKNSHFNHVISLSCFNIIACLQGCLQPQQNKQELISEIEHDLVDDLDQFMYSAGRPLDLFPDHDGYYKEFPKDCVLLRLKYKMKDRGLIS